MTIHGSSEWSVKLRVCISALAKCSSGGQVVVGGWSNAKMKRLKVSVFMLSSSNSKVPSYHWLITIVHRNLHT